MVVLNIAAKVVSTSTGAGPSVSTGAGADVSEDASCAGELPEQAPSTTADAANKQRLNGVNETNRDADSMMRQIIQQISK